MGQANSLSTKPKFIKFRLTKSCLARPEQTASGSTKSKFIKFKLTKSSKNQPATSGLHKSRSIKSKPTKSKPTKPPNTLRPVKSPPNATPLKDEILPWRISGHYGAKFFIRKLYRGSSIWHQYGWKKCHNNSHQACKNKDPTILFTCKKISTQARHLHNIDKSCRNVVMAFIEHRKEMGCGCNLEYITKGTTRKLSNVCESRDKAVYKAVKKHDKICTCGAFQFVQREKENGRPQKTIPHLKMDKTRHAPASSKTAAVTKTTAPFKTPVPHKTPGHASKHPLGSFNDTFDDFSEDGYKENISKGMKRKW